MSALELELERLAPFFLALGSGLSRSESLRGLELRALQMAFFEQTGKQPSDEGTRHKGRRELQDEALAHGPKLTALIRVSSLAGFPR